MCPRQDDFDGDITITAEDLPDGVTARPLVLSNKTDRGVLIVSAAQETPAWSGDIRIVGRASTNGRELVREAKFASLVWGHIFADSIRVRSRITERVPLSVNGYEDAPVIIQPAEDRPWVVEVGSKLDIPIKLIDNGSRVGNLTIEPCGLFGMHRSPPTVNIAENATEGTLSINFTKNGNFAVETGRYQFALLGTGVTKYCRNERGLALAQAEESRLAQLLQQVSAESAAAKTAADKAKADADAAVQKAKEATDEPSRTTLKAAADSAKAAFEQAQAAAKSAAERVKTVRRLRTEVDKLVKSEESKSAPKDTKFAAWSELITVEVRPAATKP